MTNSAAEITRVTGNWPFLLREFYNRAKEDTIHSEQHLKAVDQWLTSQAAAVGLLDALGIEVPRDRAVLRTLNDLQGSGPTGVSVEELTEFVDEIREDEVRRLLRWSDLLQLARPAARVPGRSTRLWAAFWSPLENRRQ